MLDPFLGELLVISFNFAPKGWAFCNGQLLPINQNQALFAILGTTYGGDGQLTFALPNLQSRVPMHTGNNHVLGERGGQAAVTLQTLNLPAHTHTFQVSDLTASSTQPNGRYLASGVEAYGGPTAQGTLSADSVTQTGGAQPHENEQPYLVLNVIIALQGIFPSRN